MPKIEPKIFSDQEIQFLRELVKFKAKFMIVGLSAAALQGAPVVTQDIDLWFKKLPDPLLERATRRVGGSYVMPFSNSPPLLVGENVKLFDLVTHMSGLGDFSEEAKYLVPIKIEDFRVPVLGLARIIKSKKAAARQKDKMAVPVLEDALKVIKHRQ